jgi:hypothetical protein
MAEERFDPREINVRQWMPWTHLFRGFWVAVDPKKLLLAALGILVMSVGWWFLSWLFYMSRTAPDYGGGQYRDFAAFRVARERWNLFYRAAGPIPEREDINDLATSDEDYKNLLDAVGGKSDAQIDEEAARGNLYAQRWKNRAWKPYGELRTWPWFEHRGPNPYLMATGQLGSQEATGAARYVPWTRGGFIDWFVGIQLPVLLEPLIKFLKPVYFLLNNSAGYLEQFYFLLVIVWTVATWAFFGGAITRMAAVELARNEKVGMGEALRYLRSRWQSYLFASFAPLIGLAAFVVLLMIFALFNWIPVFREFWNGFLWFVVLGIGFVMAILLVGLVGWPMIHATLSAEGSDSFDALSRAYSYVLQRPWSYLWYVLVSLVYGAVLVFFVGLMGSLTVYLGKWGMSQVPGTHYLNRDPSYLFVYAPSSFGWRDLLLKGSDIINQPSALSLDDAVNQYIAAGNLRPWNYIGIVLVSVWLYLVFLMVIGFGYSYFWSASTIIYLLMRRKVDDTDLDEVYLEEDETEEPYSAPVTGSAPTPQPAATTGQPLQMVEAPALRQPPPVTPPAAPATSVVAEETGPKPGDGEITPSGGTSS